MCSEFKNFRERDWFAYSLLTFQRKLERLTQKSRQYQNLHFAYLRTTHCALRIALVSVVYLFSSWESKLNKLSLKNDNHETSTTHLFALIPIFRYNWSMPAWRFTWRLSRLLVMQRNKELTATNRNAQIPPAIMRVIQRSLLIIPSP